MNPIKINSFTEIRLPDLEHIVFNIPAYGDPKVVMPTTCKVLQELKDFKFSKKYNLIYQNESLQHACDINQWYKKPSTDVMEQILVNNKDKFFMIIDHVIFDHYTLSQHRNCQIWSRKYFSPYLENTNKDDNLRSSIHQKRKHWFCSLMGRNDVFRGRMFDWIIDNGLEKDNKISYLGVSAPIMYDDKNDDNTRDLENIDLENIICKHKNLLPYNNFEKDGPPRTVEGRSKKLLPLHDSLFNVVMENFVTVPNAYHSEKTLNAILYGHIPLVVGGPGAMKKLNDMGIIVPDYIKWPIWDDVPIDQENYNKLDILQRQLLEFFSTNHIEEISLDWYPYAVKNLEKLKNLHKDCAYEEREICRWILIACGSINNKQYHHLL